MKPQHKETPVPVRFTVMPDSKHVLVTLDGKITDEELFSSYRDFYLSKDWTPESHKLCDLTSADLSGVSADCIIRIAEFTKTFFKERGIGSIRSAAYCPQDLDYGYIRMYQAYAEDSPEDMQVFRDYNEAREWLEEGTQEASAELKVS